jgi:hypothetical protein
MPRVAEFATVTTVDSVRGVKPISTERETPIFELAGTLKIE